MDYVSNVGKLKYINTDGVFYVGEKLIMTDKKYEITGLTGFAKKDDRIEVWGDSVSDGYHTMDELYDHRHELFLALVKAYDSKITPFGSKPSVSCWKAKLHSDGTMFDGFFILGMTVTYCSWSGRETKEQITYHLPMKYWHLTTVIPQMKAPEYDGHTSSDVLQRLRKL